MISESAIRELFPDAIEVISERYGFRVRIPYRDHVYVVAWRYDALPKGDAARRAVVAYLRFVGETLAARSAAHFPGGIVHRRPA